MQEHPQREGRQKRGRSRGRREVRATVVGGGLAGSEAAWQLANRGVEVLLIEMRNHTPSPAHKTDKLGELVCSNSLGGAGINNASGLLKAELKRLNSLIMQAAELSRVPAGGALAVDRDLFSSYITEKIENHPLITVERREIEEIPDAPVVIASGPLTAPVLAEAIAKRLGKDSLHFFDAAAPVVSHESLDLNIVFPQSRYDKGDGVYLNCPMDKEQYLLFIEELLKGEGTHLHLEGEKNFFEGCLPIEILASRGVETLRFGPMKPVGLTDPRTGRRPYAVVQLRQDNAAGTLFNLVGFQNQLKFGEQKRIFSLIPGLEKAEFLRLGVMHQNTYLNSPTFLHPTLEWQDDIFFAGQLIGVEGYTESIAMGLIAGLNLARRLQGKELFLFPRTTMLGALSHYVCEAEAKHFQPINSNWGLLPPLDVNERIGKKEKERKRELLGERALRDLDAVKEI
ncbi:MAG TPA: methylenetetrahydrofolate--tRNA-(uracil(54)-C(5))-methyltransferase (FADH(2)-oxidizing) TrmFO [Cyanobacteria bacterium UBA8530]|nr:methylenetetrahydrofolate--tRNA-(uracil(54)-C(5))-methyltransferase (FADH(2)-oxidizing) TrmFO [Cyanobacteria bacterium UBA8530]